MNTLLKVGGLVVVDNEGCWERLVEYSEELFRVHPLADKFAGGAPCAAVVRCCDSTSVVYSFSPRMENT